MSPIKRIMAGRTKRLRLKIVKYLEKKGPQNTQQIFDHLNKASYGGTTIQQVGNLRTKDPRFRAIGIVQTKSPQANQRYNIQVWDLTLDYKEWS